MSHSRNWSKWLLFGEVILVLAVTVTPRVITLGGTFVVNDETLYWNWANQFTNALLNQDWRNTLVGKAYPSVTIMWVQVVGFALRWLWSWLVGSLNAEFYHQLALDRSLDFGLLAQRRLPMALANAGVVMLIYLYARQLFGRRVALVSALLIGLDPFYLSDARTMRGDSLMAGFMTLSLLGLLLAQRECRLDADTGWQHLVVSAVMAGLALLTKVSSLPLIVIGCIVLGVWGLVGAWAADGDTWYHRLRHFWKIGLRPLVVWLVIIVLTCIVLWPALWVSLDRVWGALVSYSISSLDGRPSYFLGRHTEVELLPFFYPVNFFFRLTPLTLVGLALLMIAAIATIRRSLQSKAFVTFQTVSLCILVVYNLTYMSVMTAGLLKRGWYMLPILPTTLLLAANGWVRLAKWIGRGLMVDTRLPVARVFSPVAIGGLLAILIFQAVPFHPYYYAYWNPFAARDFVPHLEMLNWGIDTGLAAHWLNAQPSVEKLRVAMRPSLREFQPMFKGDAIPFTDGRPWVQADYIVLRQRHLQLREHQDYQLAYLQRLSPVYTMTLNGVVFGWIYPGPGAQVAVDSQLTGKATLLGYDLPPLPLSTEHPAYLNLYWHNRGLTSDEHLFVRLVDGGGFVWVDAPILPQPGFEEVSATSDAFVESRVDLRPPVGTPPGLYFLKIGVERINDTKLIGEFNLESDTDQVIVTRTAAIQELPPLIYTTITTAAQPFGEDLLLLGYNLPEALSPSASVVDLYWKAQRNVQEDYVLALRLRDGAGKEVWYQLARPARGIYPTPGWQAGEIVRDPWQVRPADDLLPGRYSVELEVYDGDTGRSVGRKLLGQVTAIAPAQLGELFDTAQSVFDGGVALSQYELRVGFPETGDVELRAILTWQQFAVEQGEYRVRVKLLTPDGGLLRESETLVSFLAKQRQVDTHRFYLLPSEMDHVGALQVQLYDSRQDTVLPTINGGIGFYVDNLPDHLSIILDMGD